MLTAAPLLGVFGVVAISRGIELMNRLPTIPHLAWQIGSYNFWGWAWIILGITALATVPWNKSRAAQTVISIAAGILTMWGLGYLPDVGQFLYRGTPLLGWAATIVWAVWRGRRGEIRIEVPHARNAQ